MTCEAERGGLGFSMAESVPEASWERTDPRRRERV